MKKRSRLKFSVSKSLDVVIEDDGRLDPTGILNLRLTGKDKKVLHSTPILASEVPDLVRALVAATMALEEKGLTLTMYNAGYQDAKEGRAPAVEPRWPRE